MITSIILIVVGFLFLIKGADFLVDGASAIAKRFKISEMIIGLTIVAMGTSMPELMVSVTSAIDGHSDIALGNVIGSNMANILLILGLCAFMKKINIPKTTRRIENPFCLIVTIILFGVCINGGVEKIISQKEGIFLFVVFILYLAYLFINAKKKQKTENIDLIEQIIEDDNETVESVEQEFQVKKNGAKKLIFSCIKIAIGIVGLKFGADFVVDNAIKIAQTMGISEKIISVTIIAVGTSLPELVASITAVMKGENDMAVGNIVGSNILNILLILGVAGTICPINYSLSYNFDIIYLIIASALLAIFPYIGKGSRIIDRTEGIIFFLMYIGYIVTLLFFR